MSQRVAVLLSTYNGEKYLAIQLDSILSQTYQNFVVVARDDGSDDNTAAILFNYANKHSDKIFLHMDNSENFGACRSYAFLMEYVLRKKEELGLSNAYIMFSDQDDIWKDSKIERQMEIMLETQSGDNDRPVLVHSDLEVIDFHEKMISKSFFDYQGLERNRNRLSHLALYNIVTGCTVLINEPLARLALPMPPETLMHDWWLTLCVAAFGRRRFIENTTVRYRQHEENVIGARKIEPIKTDFRGFLQDTLVNTPPVKNLQSVANQAHSFYRIHQNKLSLTQRLGLQLCSLMRFHFRWLQKICYLIILALPRRKEPL